MTDIALFPAVLLATEYHQRWQVENTIDELKVHLLGCKTPIRSQKPREVVQEVYGWLLGHWAVRVDECSKLLTTLKSLLYVWAILAH